MTTAKKIISAIFAAATVFAAVYLICDMTAKADDTNDFGKIDISAENTRYHIKEHNGKIAVFIEGETEPVYTLDSPYVRDLPEYDRQLLSVGITAESGAELIRILEDYES